MVTIITPVTDWYCPACGKTKQTRQAKRHLVAHQCPKLRGLTVPYVVAGTAAKVELHEREDFVGREKVQLDPELGRPVQSIVTTRDNGQDVAVFAPLATGSGDAA